MRFMHFVRTFVSFVVVCALVFGQGTLVLAGNTGALSGTVTDPTTKQPLAGVRVTVSSPSQSASTTTTASGGFGFLSLAPDTYTVSVQKQGYETASVSGIVVVADQTQNIQLTAQRELRTIGRTTARASGSLVKSGVTADVYNVTPAQQAAAAPLGGGNNLNSAYSAVQSTPGTLVPISDSPGWGQSIFIRGGDYTQTGNEVDGVPVNRQFDQYSGTPLSNIGNSEVQVYTGNQPVDAQANGLAGFVNQVIKTGTQPGFGNVNLGGGAPGYYRKFSAEYGGSTTNRNFTYYLGFLGYNQQNRFVDQYNGARYTSLYGSTYNYVAAGCSGAHPTAGCYLNGPSANLLGGLPLGPNGYAFAPAYWADVPATADREGVANFHFGIPHKHDGLRDDIQFLYNTGETYDTPNASMGDWGPVLGNVLSGTALAANGAVIPNGTALCPSSTGAPVPAGTGPIACAPPTQPNFSLLNQVVYTGPLYGALTAANLRQTKFLPFAGSATTFPGQVNGGAIPFSQGDSETTGFAITKLQFQHNFSSNAYARVYGYTAYSDRIDNGAVGLFQNYVGAFEPDYLISAHTSGVALTFADQLDPKNLFTFNAGYNYTNSSRFNNAVGEQFPVAYLVSSANPTGGCYSATGARATCGTAPQYAYQGGSALSSTAPGLSVANAASVSCGGAPCEFFAVGTGAGGTLNNVRPAFTNVSIADSFRPTDRLTLQAALRFEDFTYNLPATNNPGNQLLVNDYNSSHCVAGTTVTRVAVGAACPAGSVRAALTAVSPSREDYAHYYSPRFGLTYNVDPNTVLRASYGRFTQSAETSAVDATNLQAGVPSSQFYTNFGFASYARSVEPEVSYNTDFSLEHSFPRTDLQASVSPFYRTTNNEFVAILVDPKTNFIANVNGLNRKVSGVELAVTKGNFARDGFAAQLAYTFTYATAQFKVFPNGGSFVAQANTGIQTFNAYTKFCATNPHSNLCGATTSGSAAAPCYVAATGAAAPACGAGTVANPYWNSQPFGLLDPNASYFPYNQSLGAGSGGAATSYIVPHVAALILQYKKGRWTVSPTVQFQGGSRYGSPLAAQGIAPDTCGVLAGARLAGDPRYTNGIPGPGQPYNAATCGAVIPIPDPATKHFDGIGEYVQPNLIATNLSVNYEFNKRVGLNVIAANIFNRCFGGSNVPWGTGNIGCAYSQAGLYAANVYNPGDLIQPGVAQPYTPVLGGALQSVSAGSPLPFQLFVNLNVHL